MHSCQSVIDKGNCHVGVKLLQLVFALHLVAEPQDFGEVHYFEDRVHDLRCWSPPGVEGSGGPVMVNDLRSDIGQYGDVLICALTALPCKQLVAQLGHIGICLYLHHCW